MHQCKSQPVRSLFYTELIQQDKRMERINQYYSKSPVETKTMWKLGQLVAAMFIEDNGFHRARIIGFTDTGVEVLVSI